MLQLLLMRHAKSAWDLPDLDDYDRPLADRGIETAPRMAKEIATRGLTPHTVLCSAAQRARETLALALPHFKDGATIFISPALYEAEAPDLLIAVQGAGRAPSPLLLVGHNPALEDFARLLANDDGREDYRAMRMKFPTAAVAVIEFDGEDWSRIGPGYGQLVAFIRPRDLA